MPKKPERPSAAKLRAAMTMPEHKSATRWQIFEDYCYHAPKLDELPLLLDALRDEDFVVVRAAAESIAKLGPAAKDAADDLYDAAWRHQCYP